MKNNGTDAYISLAEGLYIKNKYYYDDSLKGIKINNKFFILKDGKWITSDIVDMGVLFVKHFPNIASIAVSQYINLRKAFIKVGKSKKPIKED